MLCKPGAVFDRWAKFVWTALNTLTRSTLHYVSIAACDKADACFGLDLENESVTDGAESLVHMISSTPQRYSPDLHPFGQAAW